MQQDLQQYDLLDLISNRHMQLRKMTEDIWNNTNQLTISNSEWYIISKIYKEKPTIAYITKHVNTSRQATHKNIKSLESKGLVSIHNAIDNKKVKCIQLTSFGEECYETYISIKTTLEEKISATIGAEQLESLKNILKIDWGL